MSTDPTPPPVVLRAAADRARETGGSLNTELGNWLEATAHQLDASTHPDWQWAVVDPSALAVARQLLDTTPPKGTAADVLAALEHGSVRCPLCPGTLMLHTSSGARAHFTTVHPERQISGRHGPWPALVTEQPPAPVDVQAARRDRYRRAITEAEGFRYESCEPFDYLVAADAAMALADTEQAALRTELAMKKGVIADHRVEGEALREKLAALRARVAELEQQAAEVRADTLREAAEELADDDHLIAAEELRRLADETPAATTAPARHRPAGTNRPWPFLCPGPDETADRPTGDA
ncbi:hypothetical protein [Streptomyces sp. C10-9-1]|uniref:hypothetical protein n=1 Tax=Streptomyces sp. C10-9-1 TaxID=1859285 RepID=UPI003F49C648